MKTYCILFLVTAFTIASCKDKEDDKATQKNFISVLSLIEQQVKHIDTSLYAITKVVYIDSLHSDTTYIHRDDFRKVAIDFLEIPDLSEKKVAKLYNEESHYDDLLNRVIITYTPIDEKKVEIKKQELQVTPNVATGDKVNNVMITRVISNRDGFLKKDMLWQMDKSFQIVTTTQQPGQPEKITTTKVTWNEDKLQ